jgi:hypothetical protein
MLRAEWRVWGSFDLFRLIEFFDGPAARRNGRISQSHWGG